MVKGILTCGGEIFWRSRNVDMLEIEKCTNQFSTTASSNFWNTTTWPCVIQALKSRKTRRRKYVWLDRLTMDDRWWEDGSPPQILATEIVRSSGRFSSSYTLIYGLDRRNERAKLVHTSKWSYIRDITLYTYQHTVFDLWTICNVFAFRFTFWCQDMSIIQLEGTKLVLLNTMLCAYGQKVLFTTVCIR